MSADHLNEASRWRLDLARRVAPVYSSDPAVAAVAVVGSVARGCADRHSDVELAVVWNQAPTLDARRRAAQRNAGLSQWREFDNDPDLDEWSEDYAVLGVKLDVSHRTVAGMSRILSQVVDSYDTSIGRQMVAAGVELAIPLHGADLMQAWRRRITPYPRGLARAMVAAHLQFGPHAWLERLAERDEVLSLREISVNVVKSILGILLGLNRVYHPGNKWIARTVDAMEIRPPDVNARVRNALVGEPDSSVAEVGRLISDTIGLVEEHLPDLDTARVRARIDARTPAWDKPPPALY